MSGTRTAIGAVAFSPGKLNGQTPEYTCWSGLTICPNGDLLYLNCRSPTGELGVVTGVAYNDFIRCPAGSNPLVASNWTYQARVGYRDGCQEGWMRSFTDDDGDYMLLSGNLNVGFTSFSSPDPNWYQQLYTARSVDNGYTWDAADLTTFTRTDDSPWQIYGRDGAGEQDLELTGGFVQLEDGSVLAPLTVVPRQTAGGITPTGGVRGMAWQGLVRSTDRGIEWKEYGTPPFPEVLDWQFAEANLLWLPSGRLACIARVKEVPLAEPDDYGMWINWSEDAGLTWGTPQKAFGSSASRPMEVLGPEGDIVVGYRSVIGSPGAEISGPTKWRQSWDEGETWTAATTMPLTPLGVSAYGQGVSLADSSGVDGDIAIMYQEENFGSPQLGVAYLTVYSRPLFARSVHDAAQTAIGPGTYGTTNSHRAFPSTCYHGTVGSAASPGSSGVARIIYRRSVSHAGYDGSLCSVTKVDGGSWSAEQVIIDGTQVGGSGPTNLPNSPLPDGNKPDVRDVHIWKAESGRLLITFCQHVTGSYVTGLGHTWKTWFLYSDDNGATWSTPTEVTFTGAGAPTFTQGVFADNIIELPSGNLLISGYAPVAGVFEQYVARSTDGGATWSYRGKMASSIGGFNSLEASMAILPSGTIFATFHTEDGVPTNIYKTTSTDEGATWSAPVLVMSGAGSNRNEVMVTTDGDMILSAGFAAISYANGAKQSFDMGGTFGGSYITLSTNPYNGGPLFAHGCMIGPPATSPNVGFATAYENNTQDIAGIQWTTLTRASDTTPITPATGYGNTTSSGHDDGAVEAAPAASFTINPASTTWTQVDEQIDVILVAEEPSIVSAIYNGRGGLIYFTGTDASSFEVSEDGTSWGNTLEVPAGISTIYLRCTSSLGDSALSAQVGVPF